MRPTAPSNVADDSVTASDLARHFGHWQRRALKTPVYVLNHGRPQFVLASIEFMQALSSARPPQPGGDLTELLDALFDPVLICDPTGTVTAAGRAARLHFGRKLQPGAPLAAFLPTDCAEFLGAIVSRVADTGLTERAELPGAAGRTRLQLVIEPSAIGVVIVGSACGLQDARDLALAHEAALFNAVEALPGHAVATIGLRGLLTETGPSLSRLSGRASQALEGTPAHTLFSPGSRAALDDAIDAAFASGDARVIKAELLTVESGSIPVSIGLAPLRRGFSIEAVRVVIARQV